MTLSKILKTKIIHLPIFIEIQNTIVRYYLYSSESGAAMNVGPWTGKVLKVNFKYSLNSRLFLPSLVRKIILNSKQHIVQELPTCWTSLTCFFGSVCSVMPSIHAPPFKTVIKLCFYLRFILLQNHNFLKFYWKKSISI